MFSKNRNTNEILQKNRRVALELMHRLAIHSGDRQNNTIYITYNYNGMLFGAIQYRVNISGNIEIYSEIGQIIFAGNDIFNIYDFIMSLSPNNIAVMSAMLEALRFEHNLK